mgnify:CR=1 FL=1
MALKETVTIEVEVEGEGLKKLTLDAKGLKKALRGLDGPSKKTGKNFGETAELAERMRAAFGPMGDAMADITGGLDDLATALKSAGGGKVAFIGGLVLAAAAAAALGKAVLGVVANVDDYKDQITSLQRRGIISDKDVESLYRANAAITAMGGLFSDIAIVLAVRISPLIEEFGRRSAIAFGYLQDGYDGAAAAALDFQRKLSDARVEQVRLAEEARLSSKEAKKAADEQKKADDEKRKREAATAKRLADRKAATSAMAGMVQEAMLQEADGLEKIALAYQVKIDKLNELVRINPILAGQAETLLDLLQEQRDTEIEIARAAADRERMAAAAAALEQVKSNAKQEQEISADVLKSQMANMAKMKESRDEDGADQVKSALNIAAQVLAVTATVATGIEAIVGQQLDNEVNSYRKGSAAHKKAAKKAFRTKKALALVSAGINTALAVVNAFATAPTIIAGAALAVVAAVVGATQIGLIAGTQMPSFHRGGMLPDERSGGRAITRQNEAQVVITAQGQRSFADAVNALNRGDGGGGGGVTVMLDSRPIRGVVYAMGQEDPAYGHRRRS